MTRVAFDTNVLLYPALEPATAKAARARDLINRAGPAGVIAVQVLGEYLRKMQRQKQPPLASSIAVVKQYQQVFFTPATTPSILDSAALLALNHKLQYWDAVVVVASVEAGAKTLLSEDMQDGGSVGGLQILNPFNPANDPAIDALLQ